MLCYNLAHHVVRAPSDCFQLALALFSLTLTEQQQVNIDLSRMESKLFSVCHQPWLSSSLSPSKLPCQS